MISRATLQRVLGVFVVDNGMDRVAVLGRAVRPLKSNVMTHLVCTLIQYYDLSQKLVVMSPAKK